MDCLLRIAEDLSWVTCCEIFAGCKAVASAFRAHGWESRTIERDDCFIWENIESDRGFLYAISMFFRMMRGGSLLWLAPVCGSWIWASRSGSGRTFDDPDGNTKRAFVRSGNLQCVRCDLCVNVCVIVHA